MDRIYNGNYAPPKPIEEITAEAEEKKKNQNKKHARPTKN
jgi:hypothetical protein